MSTRRASASVFLLVSCLALTAAVSVAAAPAGSTGAKLTIQAWPQGLFGYMTSSAPGRCAGKRQVVLFEQQGKVRDRRTDRRLGGDRTAGKAGSYQWSVKTGRAGRFYAVAAATPGCAASASETISTVALRGSAADDGPDYPSCSPYVSEGSSYICKFDQMHLWVPDCTFGDSSGSCDGKGKSGLFPWGTERGGGEPDTQVFWTWSNHKVTIVSYRADQERIGTAFLGGTMPSSNSSRFSIYDAFAQNDRGREIGDHFYTPDLPGQEAGEVGGPLFINFINGGAGSVGHVYVHGYLYLTR